MNEATRKVIAALRDENARLREQNKAQEDAYVKLYETAEAVSDAALIPGICRPTWRGESGERRLIVATRPLDRLVDMLLGEAPSGMEED